MSFLFQQSLILLFLQYIYKFCYKNIQLIKLFSKITCYDLLVSQYDGSK